MVGIFQVSLGIRQGIAQRATQHGALAMDGHINEPRTPHAGRDDPWAHDQFGRVFGSATLIVLAGLIGATANLTQLHGVVAELPFLEEMSLGLFSLNLAMVAVVLAISFFFFTYALRKLIYTSAMLGGLPINPPKGARRDGLVETTAIVLTEAVKSFNSGIRGCYFAVVALFLFAGPIPRIAATLFVITLLFWRQLKTRTSDAIGRYVELLESEEDED